MIGHVVVIIIEISATVRTGFTSVYSEFLLIIFGLSRAFWAQVARSVEAFSLHFHAVEMKHFIAAAFANNELFFRGDVGVAYITDRRIHIIFRLVIDSEAEVSFALFAPAVTFGERRLKSVELVIKS